MCSAIERLLCDVETHNLFHVVEVGCGTGLSGIVAAKHGCRCTLTDRCSDLAVINVDHVFGTGEGGRDVVASDLSWENSGATHTTLSVDPAAQSAKKLIAQRGKADLIVGAEITCLRKQQTLLVNTLLDLCESNPHALVLLSFDGTPPPNDCMYEQDMIAKMTEKGFRHQVVYVADCSWEVKNFKTIDVATGEAVFAGKESRATLRDRTSEFCDLTQALLYPRRDMKGSKAADVPVEMAAASQPRPSMGSDAQVQHQQPICSTSAEQTTHHITLFYRPAAVGVCSRCQREYLLHPSLPSASLCVHHQSFFVCRYHPAELRCSINGVGDGLGYYGNGQEGYAAKFWDCCGAEEQSALGCCRSKHIPY
jgi:hypothetical protein